MGNAWKYYKTSTFNDTGGSIEPKPLYNKTETGISSTTGGSIEPYTMGQNKVAFPMQPTMIMSDSIEAKYFWN